MKRLVVDLDGTLTIDDPNLDYLAKIPNHDLVCKLREYKEEGYDIIVHTARNMRTHNNSVGKITAHTLPVIIDWLNANSIPFDEIHIGKPWCGTEGFYVDDRAIRPDEFVRMTSAEIQSLLGMSNE